ncbi:hypothetical protein PL11201_510018 [Planktothrix sp. PCC 11201]|nr:hypothetical protein PL11201_510018 [Planktothrix sp. PCC 11201]
MYKYFLGYARIEITTQVLSESQNTWHQSSPTPGLLNRRSKNKSILFD